MGTKSIIVLAPPTILYVFSTALIDAPRVCQWLIHVMIQWTVSGRNFSPARTRRVCCHGNTIRFLRVSCCIWRSGCLRVNMVSDMCQSHIALYLSFPSLPAFASPLCLPFSFCFALSASSVQIYRHLLLSFLSTHFPSQGRNPKEGKLISYGTNRWYMKTTPCNCTCVFP